MKKSISAVIFISLFSQSFSQSINKTMLRLPDTGETTSYTTTFGEDNDYTINPPFFNLNGNGTVTDTITGLMWQQTDGGEMTIENAILYCDTLSLGGYTDWRLPNAHESFSILNHQYTNPALDAAVFTSTLAEYWWTSDRQANDSNKIWVTNAGGGIGNHPKTETISAGGTKRFHVRAVRDIAIPPVIINHFTENFDGTITDNLTSLIWEKNPFADTLTWEEALAYADTLSLTGISDWRLPNIKELQSINDETMINPSLNSNFFFVSGADKYWSSTTLPNQTTKAWYLYTQFGITTYDLKTVKHKLICVRGNQNNTTEVSEASINSFKAVSFPNPFSTTIHLSSEEGNELCQLSDCVGQIIYSGGNISGQNFSSLPKGIYILKVVDRKTSVSKLLKE
jgi:hypothetical protein